MFRLPSIPPRPPLPGESLFPEKEEEEEPEAGDLDNEFRVKLRSEGYDPDLIEMGLKVMKNHLRTPEEAFEIGRNYVKEMSR